MSLCAIALAEILRTGRILRKKADCKQSVYNPMLKGDKANTEGVLIFSLFFSNVCGLEPAQSPSDNAGIETRKARVTARSEILRLKCET